jgi:hypothetical protein
LEHVIGAMEHVLRIGTCFEALELVFGPLEHVYDALEHVLGALEHVLDALEHVFDAPAISCLVDGSCQKFCILMILCQPEFLHHNRILHR